MDEPARLNEEEKAKIIEQISEFAQISPDSVIKVIATKPTIKDFIMPFLLAIVILGSLATCYAIWKTRQNGYQAISISQKLEKQTGGLKSAADDTDARLKKVEARLEVIGNRVWLLAITQNENTWLSKNNQDKSRYVYLTQEWKLSKMPEHVNMPEADKRLLIQSVQH